MDSIEKLAFLGDGMNVFSPIIWQTSSWKGKQTLLGMWGQNNTQKRGQQKFPNKQQRKPKKVWSVCEGIGRKMEFRILERARFRVFALFNSRADNAKTSDFAFTPSRFLSSKEPQKLCRYSSKLNKKSGLNHKRFRNQGPYVQSQNLKSWFISFLTYI